MLRIFIGWDARFPQPARVLAYSIRKHASIPVDIRFLHLGHLQHVYNFCRAPDPLASNEFAYSRFLVPWLVGYQGKAVFMDNDMLCVGDVRELDELPVDSLHLRCRKHDYRPTSRRKMYGCPQTSYPRKNWSSLMILNCGNLRVWSKRFVESASGVQLHQFDLIPDSQIGDIPEGWNDLTDMRSGTRLLHMTEGGPWFPEYENCPGADLWRTYRDEMELADKAET